MLMHLPMLLLLVVSMGLLVDGFHANCNDRPVILGSEYLISGSFVRYRCAPWSPGDTTRRWNCRTKCWSNGLPRLTCTGGGWGPWGLWGLWTSTCGYGIRTRTRTCTTSIPCPGSNTDTQTRTLLTPCPVNGNWGAWTPGLCVPPVCPQTLPTQTRTRLCNNPAPANGGANCVGLPTDVPTVCTIAGPSAACPNYMTMPCNSPPQLLLPVSNNCWVPGANDVMSVWVQTETSGSVCACDTTYGPLGTSIIVIGGCQATFHVCFA